jgi:hypothetical protein
MGQQWKGSTTNKIKNKQTYDQQLLLENKNATIRSSGRPSTTSTQGAECNEATQNGPSTHSQGHKAHSIPKNIEVKQKRVWRREEIRQGIWF